MYISGHSAKKNYLNWLLQESTTHHFSKFTKSKFSRFTKFVIAHIVGIFLLYHHHGNFLSQHKSSFSKCPLLTNEHYVSRSSTFCFLVLSTCSPCCVHQVDAAGVEVLLVSHLVSLMFVLISISGIWFIICYYDIWSEIRTPY